MPIDNTYVRSERMEDVPVFPDPPAITTERTLAIIKPDAVDREEEIKEEIKSHGFAILQVGELQRRYQGTGLTSMAAAAVSPFMCMAQH